MEIDENLASVHAYLCADGYVIKNPENKKQKYYMLGLRNTNLILLKDFQEKFEKVFGKKPYLIEGQRCRIGSKEIYEKLTNQFGSFYSWEWGMPEMNSKLSKIWLKSFFDCEGWVFCKSHQNRHVGLDCVNKNGLKQIKNKLKEIGINVIWKESKKRKIFRIFIYGKDNLIKFKEEIGFLHPDKSEKLSKCVEDYINYDWIFPKENSSLKEFLIKIMNEKAKVNESNKIVRIISKEEDNLNNLKKIINLLWKIESKVYKRINGVGTIYFEMNINKEKDIKTLIRNNLLNETEKEKWLKSKKLTI